MTPSPYMKLAISEARRALLRGEVPVGAVVVDGTTGAVLATSSNRTYDLCDPTAHAEVLALRKAAERHESPKLVGCDIYVTLEPCPMCAAAISLARIRRLYFGAYDPKSGGVEHGPRVFARSTCHHRPELYGGIAQRAGERLLEDFFARTRKQGLAKSRCTVSPEAQTRP